MNQKKLKRIANEIRQEVLTISYKANKAHISSSLSIVDILTVLYWDTLQLEGKNKDKFILSKGHAAPALYCVLYKKGIITRQLLESYGKNGTFLGVHPEHKVSGIELSTGSLGHGLSVGSGLALALKINKNKGNVFVLISDAECQEGSIWEAAQFSSHQKLNNLFLIIDYNNTQAFGITKDVSNLEPFEEKWKSFGWKTYEIDGKDLSKMKNLFSKKNKKPTVFICKTTSGSGVSFMEGQVKWHYLNLDEKLYNKSISELSKK